MTQYSAEFVVGSIEWTEWVQEVLHWHFYQCGLVFEQTKLVRQQKNYKMVDKERLKLFIINDLLETSNSDEIDR